MLGWLGKRTAKTEGKASEKGRAVPAAPSREERRRRIAESTGGAAQGHFVPFRGAYLETPVAQLPSELLLYRADNGRLMVEVAQLLREQGREWEAWYRAREERDVQELLHGLLLAKARDPRGPIFQELEGQGRQVEPLLVTTEGLVVNGNRRLAAMRELYQRDPRRYASFAEVRVAVLPSDVEPADIEFIEAALQMAPETKLSYGWIERRLKLRRQRDVLGLAVARICEAYRLEGPEQLERELAELALAEDYLENFLGEAGRYAAIADAEPLFVGLHEQLAALPPGLRARWRLAGFMLIDGRTAVQGPLERHFPFAPPVPDQLPSQALRRFAQERDLLGEAVDEGERLTESTSHALDHILADRRHSIANAKALFELMEGLRAEHLERRAPARVLRRIRSAREIMERLDPESLNQKQRRQLRGDLAALQEQATNLLGDDDTAGRSG